MRDMEGTDTVKGKGEEGKKRKGRKKRVRECAFML